MIALVENVEFWKALAALLWPILVLIVFFSARNRIYAFLDRDNLSIKVAGMEINVADATKSLGTDVSDLQKRLADIEARLGSAVTPTNNRFPKNNIQESLGEPISGLNETQSFSILWVDDYPSNNAFLIQQFQKDGIEVELALSTNEGLNKLSDESFDMIITDLGRRENERDNPFAGLEFIKQVREQNNNIPILVYAGDRGMQNQSKLLKAGATKVTQSPVEVQSFINGLRRKLS